MVTMHCIALAELASLLAHQAPAIFQLRPNIAADSLTRYWIQSRQRLDQWHRGLAGYTLLEHAGRPLAMQTWWADHAPLLEEIIVSETLTRVFAAIGFGIDQARNQREVEPRCEACAAAAADDADDVTSDEQRRAQDDCCVAEQDATL